VESLSPQHGASSGCGCRNGLQIWRLAANIFNTQSWTDNKGCPPACGLGVKLTTLHRKKFVTKTSKEPRTWTEFLDERLKLWNTDMRFGTWNVRSLYRAGSLKTVSRDLVRYKLDLVGVEVVRWEGGGTGPEGE
jgi:hypothetical protein